MPARRELGTTWDSATTRPWPCWARATRRCCARRWRGSSRSARLRGTVGTPEDARARRQVGAVRRPRHARGRTRPDSPAVSRRCSSSSARASPTTRSRRGCSSRSRPSTTTSRRCSRSSDVPSRQRGGRRGGTARPRRRQNIGNSPRNLGSHPRFPRARIGRPLSVSEEHRTKEPTMPLYMDVHTLGPRHRRRRGQGPHGRPADPEQVRRALPALLGRRGSGEDLLPRRGAVPGASRPCTARRTASSRKRSTRSRRGHDDARRSRDPRHCRRLASLAVAGPGAATGAPAASGHDECRSATAPRDRGRRRHRHQVAAARDATRKYHDHPPRQEARLGLFRDQDGIACIAMPGMGAMGVHLVNGDVVGTPRVSCVGRRRWSMRGSTGHRRLVALEYLVLRKDWGTCTVRDAPRPSLFGQRSTSPARATATAPAFYSLHAWIWKHNPAGPSRCGTRMCTAPVADVTTCQERRESRDEDGWAASSRQ